MRSASVLILSAGVGALAQGGPTVTILNGTLQGVKCPTTDVNSFLSIPFGKPPVDDLRFAPPQPWDQKFSGTYDASKPAPACPQFSSLFAEWTGQSEDCLFIDVWAPSNAQPESRLPVKVWLYGGGNSGGGISNPLYDGCFANLGLTGNYGIQDQLLGLHWAQENIAAFGGDPSKVLLFGESAGAADAFVISTLPQAKGLFSSLILESGDGTPLPTLADASTANAGYIADLNCTTLACLRSVPLTALNTTYQRTSSTSSLGPVVDGGVIIAGQPLEIGPKVPSLVGTNTNEYSLFLLAQFQYNAFSLNASSYDTFLTTTFGANASAVNASYPLSRFSSAPVPAFAAMAATMTDSRFRCPARRVLAAAARRGVASYTYSFAQTPSCSWFAQIPGLGPVLKLLGAAHSSEIAYVFGQVAGLPRPGGNCSFSEGEVAISDAMMAAWDSMAASGEPGKGWPAYEAGGSSMGANIGDGKFELGRVDYSMCDFWDRMAGVSLGGGVNGSVNGTGEGAGSGQNDGRQLRTGWTIAILIVCLAALSEYVI